MYLLAFYVAFNFGKDPPEKVFNNWFESFYDLLILALHATDEVYEAMLQIRYVVVSQVLFYYTIYKYQSLPVFKSIINSQILLVIFLVIVSILLVNLLIAMVKISFNYTLKFIYLITIFNSKMAHTYNVTTGLKREWLRQVC